MTSEQLREFILPIACKSVLCDALCVSLLTSIYLVVGISVERWLAVCKPHLYRELQTRQSRCLLYIAPALSLSVLVNIPKWLEAEHNTYWYNCLTLEN